MFRMNRQMVHEGARTEKPQTKKENQGYVSPTLHVVGKAKTLVQGGGGSFADNNRARQY